VHSATRPEIHSPTPSKQAVYHFEHSLSLGALGMKSQGHGKLWRHKAGTLKAKGRRELEGGRASRVGEKQDMAATRRVNPFLKADFPARALKRHGQGLPRCAPGSPSYDMGARPHMSYKLARSAKKANRRTRSVQPPCGYTPVGVLRPGGPSGRRVSVAACPGPDGSSARASAKGEKRGGRRPA
jgi:hypothetical protein